MQILDFSALGAQAIAQVERAQRAARDQLVAAMNHRPKLFINLELVGPKVAIPVPKSDTEGEQGSRQPLSHAAVVQAEKTQGCDCQLHRLHMNEV